MIIGITGYATSGKDEIGKILVNRFNFERLSFADPIRESLYILNPYISLQKGGEIIRLAKLVDDIGWDEAKKEPEVRRLLQVFGTDVGRNILGDDVWIDLVKKQVEEDKNYVITDLRFNNELSFLDRVDNSVIIKVKRDGVGPVNEHTSDSGIPDNHCDHIIFNNGTLDELRENVFDLVTKEINLNK